MLILDTDPGVDDAMAIAYALTHPDIDLLALTVVFGNINIDFATRNAQYILDVLGATDVVVAKGAAVPSIQAARPHSDFVHGADGIGNIYPGSTPEIPAANDTPLREGARHAHVHELDAADFIIQSARENPGEITLVAVGPLTNIAEALRREPALPDLVAGLVIMGGTVIEPGNVSPVSEANFLNDPHAVGLDVTHKIMLGDSHLKLLGEKAGLTGDLIWRSSRFYVDFYTKVGAAKEAADNGAEPQCAMHDAAAIAYVVMPESFTVLSGAARVVHDGVAVGQFAIDRKGYTYAVPEWEGRPHTTACMEVDSEKVRNDFLQTIIDNHKR